MAPIRIGPRIVGSNHAPFVIAEMSGNHNQSLERALAIVEAVAKAGAHAVKLQTYTAETMTLDIADGVFFIDDPNSLWTGQSFYELFEKAHTPWEWHAPILRRANELGLIAFSSPFDQSAVDFLETLDVPCYKIASFENTDLPLIRAVASTGKPLLISTGMASESELSEAVQTARDAGCNDIVLLKCTSSYPATAEGSNLSTIPDMRERFGCEIGISDHTLGIGTSVAAVALGATVIEKHLTLSRADGGVDAAFSMEPAELASLVLESTAAWQAIGDVHYGPTRAEMGALKKRRSLYITVDLKAGAELTRENVRAIRPGGGLAPKYLDELLGRHVKEDVGRGTPVTWDLLTCRDSTA